jgi:hypothetical protein
MGGVGGGQHPSAGLVELSGVAVVDRLRVIIAIPECRCAGLSQPKHCFKNARASWMEPNRSGKPGRYFKVLTWLSEYGLSLQRWGREWVLVSSRSASRNATGLEVIDEPRSACTVRVPGRICWVAVVSASSRSAGAACSAWATIQPTT